MKRGVSGRDEAAAQLAELRKMRLNQQAAAGLLDVPVHTLRDWNAPRDEKDRSYNVIKLVQWAIERERKKRPVIDLKAIDAEIRAEQLIERRRKNQIEAGLLEDKAKLRDQLRGIGKRLFENVKAIGHRFGTDAERAMLKAILDAKTAWEKSAGPEPQEKSA